jgi:hypothetical protein
MITDTQRLEATGTADFPPFPPGSAIRRVHSEGVLLLGDAARDGGVGEL